MLSQNISLGKYLVKIKLENNQVLFFHFINCFSGLGTCLKKVTTDRVRINVLGSEGIIHLLNTTRGKKKKLRKRKKEKP